MTRSTARSRRAYQPYSGISRSREPKSEQPYCSGSCSTYVGLGDLGKFVRTKLQAAELLRLGWASHHKSTNHVSGTTISSCPIWPTERKKSFSSIPCGWIKVPRFRLCLKFAIWKRPRLTQPNRTYPVRSQMITTTMTWITTARRAFYPELISLGQLSIAWAPNEGRGWNVLTDAQRLTMMMISSSRRTRQCSHVYFAMTP